MMELLLGATPPPSPPGQVPGGVPPPLCGRGIWHAQPMRATDRQNRTLDIRKASAADEARLAASPYVPVEEAHALSVGDVFAAESVAPALQITARRRREV